MNQDLHQAITQALSSKNLSCNSNQNYSVILITPNVQVKPKISLSHIPKHSDPVKNSLTPNSATSVFELRSSKSSERLIPDSPLVSC
jgi:hypothetical protein